MVSNEIETAIRFYGDACWRTRAFGHLVPEAVRYQIDAYDQLIALLARDDPVSLDWVTITLDREHAGWLRVEMSPKNWITSTPTQADVVLAAIDAALNDRPAPEIDRDRRDRELAVLAAARREVSRSDRYGCRELKTALAALDAGAPGGQEGKPT